MDGADIGVNASRLQRLPFPGGDHVEDRGRLHPGGAEHNHLHDRRLRPTLGHIPTPEKKEQRQQGRATSQNRKEPHHNLTSTLYMIWHQDIRPSSS